MEAGQPMRMRIGMDEHGQGGFTVVGTLIDENNNFFAVRPLAIVVRKTDVGSLEELPADSSPKDALKTVSVGRQSYLGQTSPMKVERLVVHEEAD